VGLIAAHCSSTEQWWNKNLQGKLYFEKSSSHAMWHTVAQLVKEPRYKLEGCEFESQ
jgi:hypothetical protein